MAEKKSKLKKQDELVRKQGDAFIASYNLYMEELIHVVKKTDDYIVTVAFGATEGMYEMQTDKSLEWVTPEGYGFVHMSVVIQDRDDKRFVPNLEVFVRLYDNDNKLITESEAPFLWNPYVFHYGMDLTIPEEGNYTAEVTIKRPDFNRQNKDHGNKYTNDVTIRLQSVKLTPSEDVMADIPME